MEGAASLHGGVDSVLGKTEGAVVQRRISEPRDNIVGYSCFLGFLGPQRRHVGKVLVS